MMSVDSVIGEVVCLPRNFSESTMVAISTKGALTTGDSSLEQVAPEYQRATSPALGSMQTCYLHRHHITQDLPKQVKQFLSLSCIFFTRSVDDTKSIVKRFCFSKVYL